MEKTTTTKSWYTGRWNVRGWQLLGISQKTSSLWANEEQNVGERMHADEDYELSDEITVSIVNQENEREEETEERMKIHTPTDWRRIESAIE